MCFFYVPFALLLPLLAELRWTRRLLVTCLGVSSGSRSSSPASRSSSSPPAPADPQLEGPDRQRPQAVLPRQLAVLRPEHLRPLPGVDDDLLTAAAAVVAARARRSWLWPRVLAVLWAGLVISLSQSSFLALLVGLAVLAALRWQRAAPCSRSCSWRRPPARRSYRRARGRGSRHRRQDRASARPRRPDQGRRRGCSRTGPCTATAPARSPSGSARASTSAPSASRRSPTRSR